MIDRPAAKFLSQVDPVTKRRLQDALLELAENPRINAKKLKGYENTYRKRVGDIRIIYDVHDNELRVLVLKIGPRGNVYDRI